MNATRTATIALIATLAAAGCAQTETRWAGAPPVTADTEVEVMPAAFDTTVEAPRATVAPPAPTTTEPPITEPPVTIPPVETPSEPTVPPTVPPTDPPTDPPTAPPTEVGVTVPPTVPPTDPPVKVLPTDPPITIPPVIVAVTVPPITIPPVIVAPVVPDCGVFGDIPGDASGIETMLIDVDDNGVVDTVTTYFAAIGDSAGWRLRTELASGPMDDIAIEGVGPGIGKILGAVQVDHMVVDPATWGRELLVQAGANSSGPNLAVYGLENGCLFRFEDGVGTDLVIPVHASIGTMSGLRCDAVSGHQFLVTLEAEHVGGNIYNAAETILERSGQTLLPSTVIESAIDADSNGDWLNQFGELHCSGISL